jgi:hypothetical protein
VASAVGRWKIGRSGPRGPRLVGCCWGRMEEWASRLGQAGVARLAEVVEEIEKWSSNSFELLNLI